MISVIKKMKAEKFNLKVELNENWRFRIKKDSPQKIILKSFMNNYLINPLYYKNIYGGKKLKAIEFHEDLFLEVGVLIFEIINYDDESSVHYDLGDFFPKFVSQVRWKSQQTSIDHYNPFFMAESESEFELLPVSIKRHYFENSQLNSVLFNNLIQIDHLIEADDRIFNNFEIPVYEEILLDAKAGLVMNDYRKTITYSTIALESMLSAKIEEFYIDKKLNSQSSVKYRFRSKNSKGKNVVLDPIYRKLKSINSFSLLLNELPLYVMNKSLFYENENLYQSALKLYRTRNKIVHLGDIPQENEKNFLTIDKEGAQEAYKTVLEIFRWMGIEDFEFISPGKLLPYNEFK